MVVFLGQGAVDLHMVQFMPLPPHRLLCVCPGAVNKWVSV